MEYSQYSMYVQKNIFTWASYSKVCPTWLLQSDQICLQWHTNGFSNYKIHFCGVFILQIYQLCAWYFCVVTLHYSDSYNLPAISPWLRPCDNTKTFSNQVNHEWCNIVWFTLTWLDPEFLHFDLKEHRSKAISYLRTFKVAFEIRCSGQHHLHSQLTVADRLGNFRLAKKKCHRINNLQSCLKCWHLIWPHRAMEPCTQTHPCMTVIAAEQ